MLEKPLTTRKAYYCSDSELLEAVSRPQETGAPQGCCRRKVSVSQSMNEWPPSSLTLHSSITQGLSA